MCNFMCLNCDIVFGEECVYLFCELVLIMSNNMVGEFCDQFDFVGDYVVIVDEISCYCNIFFFFYFCEMV